MIVITATLVSANDGHKETLGVLLISNDGKILDPRRGNYDFDLRRKPDFERTTKRARVEDWAKQSKTIWQLVCKGLNQLYPNG